MSKPLHEFEFTPEEQAPEIRNVSYTAPVMADVRKEWHWVRDGIQEILDEIGTLTYRPEDVYASCLTGGSVLWITHEGFVVSTTNIDPFTDNRLFLIWLAWSKQKNTEIAVKHQPFFEKYARDTGHVGMELRSPYLGLMKYMTEKLGWTLDTIIYTKAL